MCVNKNCQWRWVLLLSLLFLSACASDPRPTVSARFVTGAHVRIVSDTPSVILFTACVSRFSGAAGLANSGDEGVVLKSEYCGGMWWYQVQVTALKNEKWQGIGWVAEESLRIK
ncbi:MAG: hypothetical protein HZC38_18765 [Chloroflexi bacterium]|nr:hypothetical protein [Chloroflexota bacterium]